MLTFVLAALVAVLWIECALEKWRAIRASMPLDEAFVWMTDDLPPSARAARATVFAIYLLFWPVLLLICARRAPTRKGGAEKE
jgi:hypothetical protein